VNKNILKKKILIGVASYIKAYFVMKITYGGVVGKKEVKQLDVNIKNINKRKIKLPLIKIIFM